MRLAQVFIIIVAIFTTSLMLIYEQILTFSESFILVELLSLFLIIFLFRTFYLRDTFVDSPFFSIDRVRTIRFVTAYYIVICIVIFLLLLSFFVTLGGLVGLIVAIVITLLNAMIGIYALFAILITGGSPGFIDYGIVLELVNFIFETGQIYTTEFGVILGAIFALIAISIGAFMLGRYVEDKDTSFAAILFSHMLIFSMSLIYFFTYFWSSLPRIKPYDPSYYLLAIVPLSIPYAYYLSSRIFAIKEKKDEYELPHVKKWVRRISFLVILGFFAISVFTVMYGTIIFVLSYSEFSIILLVGNSILGTVTILCAALLALWLIHGDYPVTERIFEIEYREELLEKAQAFKDL